jgi:hypothetical protein
MLHEGMQTQAKKQTHVWRNTQWHDSGSWLSHLSWFHSGFWCWVWNLKHTRWLLSLECCRPSTPLLHYAGGSRHCRLPTPPATNGFGFLIFNFCLFVFTQWIVPATRVNWHSQLSDSLRSGSSTRSMLWSRWLTSSKSSYPFVARHSKILCQDKSMNSPDTEHSEDRLADVAESRCWSWSWFLRDAINQDPTMPYCSQRTNPVVSQMEFQLVSLLFAGSKLIAMDFVHCKITSASMQVLKILIK